MHDVRPRALEHRGQSAEVRRRANCTRENPRCLAPASAAECERSIVGVNDRELGACRLHEWARSRNPSTRRPPVARKVGKRAQNGGPRSQQLRFVEEHEQTQETGWRHRAPPTAPGRSHRDHQSARRSPSVADGRDARLLALEERLDRSAFITADDPNFDHTPSQTTAERRALRPGA